MEEEEEGTISVKTHRKRLKAKQDALDALEERYNTLQKDHETLKAQQAETPDYAKLEKRYNRLSDQHEKLTAEFETYKGNATTREALLGAGITDGDDMDLVRWRWERIPEGERPTLADYLGEEGAARKDRHLSSLFKGADASDNGADTAQGDQRRRAASSLPGAQKGTQPPGAPPKTLSMEAILQMDPSERTKPENREAIWKALNSG